MWSIQYSTYLMYDCAVALEVVLMHGNIGTMHGNIRTAIPMLHCSKHSRKATRTSTLPLVAWQYLHNVHSFWILDWCLSRRSPPVPLVKSSRSPRVSHETPVSRPPKCRDSAGLRCYKGFSQLVLSGNACNLQQNKPSIRETE